MVLEVAVHCMHVVEYLQQHELFEIRQTVEVSLDDPVQAAVSPPLVMNELCAVARCHDVTSFRLSMDIIRAIAHIWLLAFWSAGHDAQAAHESPEVCLASEITRDG